MADYFYANIEIWGKFDRGKIEELLDVLDVEQPANFTIEDNSSEISPQKAILESYNEKMPLYIEDKQARCGEFEVIESFCIDNNIPFLRTSSGYCEYTPEEVYYDGQKLENIITDADGYSVIRISEIEDLLPGEDATVDESLSALEKIKNYFNQNKLKIPKERKMELSDDAVKYLETWVNLVSQPDPSTSSPSSS